MPYCPNGHGQQAGNTCDICGAPTQASPPPQPTEDSSVRIRTQENSAHFHNVVQMGGESKPALFVCPEDGRRNPGEQTFDCRGPCRREYLCLSHQDAELGVCSRCAAYLRPYLKQAAAFEAAKAELEQVRRQLHDAERATLAAKQECADLTTALAAAERKALEADRHTLDATRALAQAEQEIGALREKAGDADVRATALSRELDVTRLRATEAQSKLAALRAKELEAEAVRKAAEVEHIWKRIGIELVTIPAGHFLYGDNKARVFLAEFQIGKTPVTNAQYKAFVDATGHKPPASWERGRIPGGKEKHPVVEVSWEDAMDFCDWAGVRLPSEQEWEKAARGADGRTYPWGEEQPTAELCNFSNQVGSTTAVGAYPEGASPYGLLDMAGNVEEWCAEWYDGEKDKRVCRGGHFADSVQYTNCSKRWQGSPRIGKPNTGFRVATSSS